jgi:hypothetical protein
MNLRTLLIITGLALPIVVFAILSQSGTQSPKTQQAAPATPATPQQPAAAQKPANVPPPATQAAPVAPAPAENAQPGNVSAPPVLLPPISNNEAPVNNAAPVNAAPLPVAAPITLEQAREKVKARLAVLEKLTPEQWPIERTKHPNAPATLQQALDYNRNKLAKLSAMTEQQWDAEQQSNAAKAQKWNDLTPEQRLQLIDQQQQKLQGLKQDAQQPATAATNSPDAPSPAAQVPVPAEMPAPTR